MNQLDDKIAFSCKRIVLVNGKKHYEGLEKGWSELTESNIVKSHKVRGILTGKKNNLTVIDFDDKTALEEFQKKVEEYKIDLSKYFNVDTRKGKHYYFEYIPEIKSASNIYTTFAEKGVDCRNDGGFITAPPTTYFDEDDNVCKYTYVSGDILPMPFVIKKMFIKNLKLKKNPKKEVEEIDETSIYETVESIVNILPREYYDKGYYSNWIKVGIALYNTDTNFKEIFYQFSRKSEDFDEDEVRECVDKFWNSITEKENKLTFGSIIYWAKQTNPIAVSQILKNRKGGEQTDVGEAKYVFKLYPYWKYVNGELWAFHHGLWTNNKMIHQQIVMEYAREKYATSINHIQNLLRVLPSLCVDDNFFNRLEGSSIGKLLFNNGIYDATDNSFTTEFNPNILFMGRLPYDMDEPDEEYVKDIYQRLYVDTLDKEPAQFLCNKISTALFGYFQKDFTFCLGTNGNNGKSIFIEAINKSFGSSITGAFEPTNLMFRPNSSQEQAQKYRWALLHRHKRILMSSEMNANDYKFDSEMIKKISGGDPISGRLMGKDDVTFTPEFNLFFFANDIAKFLPLDKAVDNRLRAVQFKYHFCENPTEKYDKKMDKNLKYEINTERFIKNFLYLHIRNYQLNCINGFNIPEQCINFADDVLCDDKPKANLGEFIKESFQLADVTKDFISNDETQEWIKENELGISLAKLTIELKRVFEDEIKNELIVNKPKKIDKKTKRGFWGLKFKTE